MGININSFTPNTQIVSADVNSNFNALKSAAQDSSYRAFSWGVISTLVVADEQGMKYIVPQDLTVTKIWAKTGSGTATIRLQKDATDIKTTLAVTSTVSSTTVLDASVITAGQVLTLDVTVASGTDLYVTLETQVTTIN